MTLLQLKYISTVAKCGSFSKAAQELYVTQPGISKMVRSMEDELGITIFVRSSSGITLTAEGKELLNMGNRLLNDAEHITQHFKHDAPHDRESLSVSCQHFCFVVDAMSALQNKSHAETYLYKLLIGENAEVIQQVASKESELGVIFMGSHNQKFIERSLDDNGLEYHELLKSIPYVFLHENNPLASRISVTLEDLQDYPCIMYNLNMDSPSILHEEFFITDFYPKKVHIINSLYQSVQVMTKCNGYDLGCGVISPSNHAQGIVKRPVEGFDMSLSIGWIHRKHQDISPIATEFVNELEKLCCEE